MLALPPIPTLFPYTTLFRSFLAVGCVAAHNRDVRLRQLAGPFHGRWDTAALAGIRTLAGNELEPEALSALQKRSEEHTSELQSRQYLVCRLLLEKKNT